MSQLDGIKGTGLQRIELAYSGGSYKFNINPQNIQYNYPHRVSAVKTQQMYVIEDFNDDIQSLVIKGNTGGPRSGAENAINNLRNFWDTYNNQTPRYGQKPTENLIFYNHTEDFAWEVVTSSDGLKIERDVSHPLMWDYEMNFIVIGAAGGKAADAPFANEVTGWLYDSGRYSNPNTRSLKSSTLKLQNLNSSSDYSPNMNYANVKTGKDNRSILSQSKAGSTRAKSVMGVK